MKMNNLERYLLLHPKLRIHKIENEGMYLVGDGFIHIYFFIKIKNHIFLGNVNINDIKVCGINGFSYL
jgi:hypothetical protein